MKPVYRHLVMMSVVAMAVAMMFTSCKTSEQNYQRAYEAARQKQVDEVGGETIYNAIRRQGTTTHTVADGDSVAVRKEIIKVTPGLDIPDTSLKFYNVVAGSFRQLFHARSLMNRLKKSGYTDAFVVQTREPLYYVVAFAADSFDEIMPSYRQLRDNPPFSLMESCPWVLRPANRD